MADRLRLEFINNLPQPLFVRFFGDSWWWPVYDIDVETALIRIDVSGKLEIKDFAEVADIRDGNGHHRDPETFWTPEEPSKPTG